MNFAAAPFLRLADRLLGAEVLAEVSDFVQQLQLLYDGIQGRARSVYRLLRSPQTGFVVVTTLEQGPFGEAEFFCTKLREFKMPLRAMVVNRVLPDVFRDAGGVAAATTLVEDPKVAAWLTDRAAHPCVRRHGAFHRQDVPRLATPWRSARCVSWPS